MQLLNDPTALRGILLNYSERHIALEEKVTRGLQPFHKFLAKKAGVTQLSSFWSI